MDVVYVYKHRGTDELLYSIKLVKKYLPHDKIFVVGDLPHYLKNEDIIFVSSSNIGSKYNNTTKHLLKVCKDPRLSENFILMNDDFFIIKPITNPEEEFNLNRGTIASVYNRYLKKYGEPTSYSRGMYNTMKFIQDNCNIKDPLSFELHVPMVMNKHNVLKMYELPGVKDIKILHKRSLYGNLYITNSKPCKDVKILTCNRLHRGTPKFDQKFFSTSDTMWHMVKPYVCQLLKKPTK